MIFVKDAKYSLYYFVDKSLIIHYFSPPHSSIHYLDNLTIFICKIKLPIYVNLITFKLHFTMKYNTIVDQIKNSIKVEIDHTGDITEN